VTIVGLVACYDRPRSDGSIDRSVEFDTASLALFRETKDSAMRLKGGPLHGLDRARSSGLRYFPANPSLVFVAELRRVGGVEPVEIQATGGDVRRARRLGYFRFQIDGTDCSLAAYEMEESRGEIFVPFRDATNGTLTYEAGRYLDVVAEGDRFRLDFNYAYNPYCAYNAAYSCPRVPGENVLSVGIRAGEMAPMMKGINDH